MLAPKIPPTKESDFAAAAPTDSLSATFSDHLSPTSSFSLVQVAEGVLRQYFDDNVNISLLRVDELQTPAEWQELIVASSSSRKYYCYKTEDGKRGLIGFSQEFTDFLYIHHIHDSGFSHRFLTHSEAERIASAIAFYHRPIRELVGLYASKIDPLLQKYNHYLDDFESSLDLSRHSTQLQLEYERYCKLQWIIYRHEDDSEEVVPVDIQEMQDIQRILLARRKEAWHTTTCSERSALDSACQQIMDEATSFYLSQVDHHLAIIASVRYLAKVVDRALSWLSRRAPFDDTALNKRLELADTPQFFERFASLYLTQASVRTP